MIADDDPCISVRLTDGEEIKQFRISEGRAGWIYASTDDGLRITLLRDRDLAIAKRVLLDAAITQLIGAGWRPV